LRQMAIAGGSKPFAGQGAERSQPNSLEMLARFFLGRRYLCAARCRCVSGAKAPSFGDV
jgi:hypothetical protein